MINAAFRLACHLPHCCFDDNSCTTAQVPLAAANKSITLALPRAADYSQLEFYSTWEQRCSVIKPNGVAAESCNPEVTSSDHVAKVASSKLVWNQRKTLHNYHLQHHIPLWESWWMWHSIPMCVPGHQLSPCSHLMFFQKVNTAPFPPFQSCLTKIHRHHILFHSGIKLSYVFCIFIVLFTGVCRFATSFVLYICVATHLAFCGESDGDTLEHCSSGKESTQLLYIGWVCIV